MNGRFGTLKPFNLALTLKAAAEQWPLLLLGLALAAQLSWLVGRWGTPAQAIWYADLTFLLVIYSSLGLSIQALIGAAPGRRRRAALLCAALLAMTLGESIFVYFELFSTSPPDISLADVCYDLFYRCWA